jgi:hypothetical protein
MSAGHTRRPLAGKIGTALGQFPFVAEEVAISL